MTNITTLKNRQAIRRVTATIAAIVAATALTIGCAGTGTSTSRAITEAANITPDYDGIYRLAYSNTGTALYYRFFDDGVLISIRSDAPATEALSLLTLENAKASRGTWRVADGELRVGVEEGVISYASRFAISANGRITLLGLPRQFDFIRADLGTVTASRN